MLVCAVTLNHVDIPESSRYSRHLFSDFYTDVFKRLIDVVAVVLALPLVVLIISVLAILILLGGHTPFYSQLRVGRGGKHFRMWKLRTMVHDADNTLKVYLDQNPSAKEEWERHQKLRYDPRITFVGRFLRKSSLDEIPQLFNVLIGDMSLVGPRPMMVGQEEIYPGRSYYNHRPGLTGPWQISDRNESSFAGRAWFDDMYDREVSLLNDFGILLRTVGVVWRCTGH